MLDEMNDFPFDAVGLVINIVEAFALFIPLVVLIVLILTINDSMDCENFKSFVSELFKIPWSSKKALLQQLDSEYHYHPTLLDLILAKSSSPSQ